MNRWDRWTQYSRGPRKPPPEHGIRMKKAGTTWWGELWIRALEQLLGGDSGRLARGKTYARAGRVHDLAVERGEAKALVTGSRPRPYETSVALAQLSDAAWAAAIAAMAAKAQFAADLLAGEMPKEIDDAFRSGGTSLFPERRADLVTRCSCPDTADPCKHIAATHYILGEAMDRDPFLLFELRGRTKALVLDALRAARSGTPERGERPHASAASRAPDPVRAVSMETVDPASYDRPRGELPALHFTFDEIAATGSVLRQLGAPPAWQSRESPEAALSPLVRRAAETARRLAMAEPPAGEATEARGADAPSAPRRSSRKKKRQKR